MRCGSTTFVNQPKLERAYRDLTARTIASEQKLICLIITEVKPFMIRGLYNNYEADQVLKEITNSLIGLSRSFTYLQSDILLSYLLDPMSVKLNLLKSWIDTTYDADTKEITKLCVHKDVQKEILDPLMAICNKITPQLNPIIKDLYNINSEKNDLYGQLKKPTTGED